ncbi:hypothetical protein GJ496_007584 [Pomphorhynchus laevis]|nr:hypothetical protein GJ496_007584 [Pomphorhynchus laevis]
MEKIRMKIKLIQLKQRASNDRLYVTAYVQRMKRIYSKPKTEQVTVDHSVDEVELNPIQQVNIRDSDIIMLKQTVKFPTI